MFNGGPFGALKYEQLLDEYAGDPVHRAIAPVLSASLSPSTTGNGFVFPELATTDLHLVADDLSAGSNWSSRVGGWVAAHTGSPVVGLETPLYPSGGFSGTNFRTAVGNFGTAVNYQIPYNAAHAITATSAVCYRLLIKVGSLAQEESYLSRYITASVKSNYRVYTKSDTGGVYRLFVEIGHSTTNALVKALVPQAGLIELVFTYDGSTKLLSMYMNGSAPNESGDIATSTGVGTIVTDTSTGVYLGVTNPVVGNPLVQGQLIEIIRHQEVLTSTVVLQQFQKMSGIVLPGDIYPTGSFGRNSFGVGKINKKLWMFGKYWPIINEKGLHCNQPFGATMYETAITDNGAAITRTAGATLLTEANSFNSQVNGKTIDIAFDGLLESAQWHHFGLNANVKSAATVVWRGINAAVGYLYIYDSVANAYYNPGTSSWTATVTPIDLSAFAVDGSGTFSDPYVSNVPFTTPTGYVGFRAFEFYVHNNSQMNATQSVRVYLCQVCDSQQFFPMPFTVVYSSGSSGTVFLGFGVEYPSSIIDWTRGEMTFSLYPDYSSARPLLSPANASTVFTGSTGTNFLNLNLGSAVYRFHDATHTVTASPSFVQNERLDFQLDWVSQGKFLRMQVTNKALSGQALFTSPLSSGNFKIGTGSQAPCSFVDNIKIYKFA